MHNHLKEKLAGAAGSVSGVASILGSWQVCHSVCLGIIALLSVLGITIVGMPLAFLTKIAVPLWSIALALLIVTVWLYATRKCISRNLIIFNAGLIIAGTPFQAVQRFAAVFWIVGGLIALTAIILFVRERLQKRCCHGN